MMMFVNIILIVAAIYLAIGFLFVIPFVIKGAQKVDEGAHGGSIGFRIIIIPGTMVFWPLLLKRWMNASKNKTSD
jgi:Na+-driven multidrug efflux pump